MNCILCDKEIESNKCCELSYEIIRQYEITRMFPCFNGDYMCLSYGIKSNTLSLFSFAQAEDLFSINYDVNSAKLLFELNDDDLIKKIEQMVMLA